MTAPTAAGLLGRRRSGMSRGAPQQVYRRDTLSAGHRLNRTRIAQAAASAAGAKDHRARRIAERIVTRHGADLVVEDSLYGLRTPRRDSSAQTLDGHHSIT
ncbi:hypothetical protein ACWEO4_14665 [Streptomyces sp. NPDC004393]|uniref:hypothetical protein n=1 Tax=Streptomyces sp. NPDC004533 TaxID=3154278 RepID=UPI0033B48A53